MTGWTGPHLVETPPAAAPFDHDRPARLWMRLAGVFAASAGLWVLIIAAGDLLLRL